jgi:hypothetical protein
MENKFLRCFAPCASRFHLSRLQFSETEYAYYTVSGASTYKRAACIKASPSEMNDDKPVKPRSSSTSDLAKKIVSFERALVLPPVFFTDKYEALSVQQETDRLNGVYTFDLKKTLLDTIHKLSEDVALLKSYNASLKS